MKNLFCCVLMVIMTMSLVACDNEKEEKNRETQKIDIVGEWVYDDSYGEKDRYIFTEWGYLYQWNEYGGKKVKYKIDKDKLCLGVDENNNMVELTYELEGTVLVLEYEDAVIELFKVDNSEKTEKEKKILEIDEKSCSTIKSCFHAAMADEDAYNDVCNESGSVIIYVEGGELEFQSKNEVDNLVKELKHSLNKLEPPQEEGKTGYRISWYSSGNGDVSNIKVITI